jgi:hypothetical protein
VALAIQRFGLDHWCGNTSVKTDLLKLRSRVLSTLRRGATAHAVATALSAARYGDLPWIEDLVQRAGWDLDDLLAGGAALGSGYTTHLCQRRTQRALRHLVALEGFLDTDSPGWRDCLANYRKVTECTFPLGARARKRSRGR